MSRAASGLDGWAPVPAEFAARYRAEGYWEGKPLSRCLDEWADRDSGANAVSTSAGETRTYGQLAQRSRRLAGSLQELGIGRHDRVVVQLPNLIEFVELTFALTRLGALPVMALPPHRRHEISYMLSLTDAVAHAVPASFRGFDYPAMSRELMEGSDNLRVVLIADSAGGEAEISIAELCERGAEADIAEPDASDVALLLLSGGTTALPKLIPRTHDDYAYNFRVSAEICGMDRESVYMVSLPISHNFPLGCPGLLGAMHAGGRVVLNDDPSPPAAFELIASEGVTHTALVPALAIGWAESPLLGDRDLSSLRLVQVGGARLNEEAARMVKPALGCQLQQVFGMAEGLLNYTRLDDPDEVIFQTQGRPASPGDEVRVLDRSGSPVAAGEPGELEARGPYTLRGYYRADEHNASAFSPDGFYRSGDVVRLTAAGNFVVEGRIKDLINRGGEKISAEEIENLILAHPVVFNVAAVAMPDPRLGERTCAFVVLREGRELSLEELCAFLLERQVAKIKLPERLEVVSELPLTNVGKVDKKALRDEIAAKLEHPD